MALCHVVIPASAQDQREQLLKDIESQFGAQAKQRVSNWFELMKNTSLDTGLGDNSKNLLANDYFNQVAWLSDLEHWGQEDYWATPVETLASNGGDCEDFSIGKYFTLTEVGVQTSKLRITYVKALDYDQAHMVLAYYPSPGAEPLILDNINKTIMPASQRTDLQPIYSFNGDSLWLAKSRGRQLSADSQKSLPQWRAVNERFLEQINGH